MARNKNTTVNDVRDQVSTLAQTIIEQAAHRAVFGAERARGAASSAKSRIPTVGRTSEEVTPTIREVALQAASAAIELWQATRERAEGVVESAENAFGDAGVVDLVERRARSAANQVAERTDDLSERAKHAAAHVADRAEDVSDRARHAASNVASRADEVREGAKHAAANVVHRADDVTEHAKEVTKNAAESTVATSRDTGATLLWTAAAAGIVFYVLLDKGRRDQLLKVVDSVVAQTREIIRDFQGFDEEFN